MFKNFDILNNLCNLSTNNKNLNLLKSFLIDYKIKEKIQKVKVILIENK